MPDGRNPTYGAAKDLLKRGLSQREVAAELGLRVETLRMWFMDEPRQVNGRRRTDYTQVPTWLKRPGGERFPFSPGRQCCDCEIVLNRYNPGPYCLGCLPEREREEAIA